MKRKITPSGKKSTFRGEGRIPAGDATLEALKCLDELKKDTRTAHEQKRRKVGYTNVAKRADFSERGWQGLFGRKRGLIKTAGWESLSRKRRKKTEHYRLHRPREKDTIKNHILGGIIRRRGGESQWNRKKTGAASYLPSSNKKKNLHP